MRISPSFASQTSFEEVNSSTVESVGDIPMDWGVVSTTESDAGTSGLRSGSREYIGQGILILDGIDSNTSRNEHSSHLSLPGSDSMPSDLDSLSDNRSVDKHNIWLVKKRVICLVGAVVIFAFAAVVGLLVRQHFKYQAVMLELGEKIHQLEKEKEELPQPPIVGSVDLDDSSTFFTLLDTCWIKAKMNVKFGECSQNYFGLCGEFVSHATESLKTLFAEHIPKLDGDNGINQPGTDEDHAQRDMATALAKYPDIIGEAMISASKAVSDMIMNLNLAIEDEASDDLLWVSETFSEAAKSAKGAVSYNFNEFVKDPVKFFTGALEEATQPAPATKVSMNGVYSTAKIFSDASVDWANSMAETSEAFANTIVRMFSKPLSFLESKDKDL
jgi:hypothetical protein